MHKTIRLTVVELSSNNCQMKVQQLLDDIGSSITSTSSFAYTVLSLSKAK